MTRAELLAERDEAVEELVAATIALAAPFIKEH